MLLHRQVAFDFDHEGRAAEEIGQEQSEQPVPIAQRLARVVIRRPSLDRLILRGSRVLRKVDPKKLPCAGPGRSGDCSA
jgi:hypothetical protein